MHTTTEIIAFVGASGGARRVTHLARAGDPGRGRAGAPIAVQTDDGAAELGQHQRPWQAGPREEAQEQPTQVACPEVPEAEANDGPTRVGVHRGIPCQVRVVPAPPAHELCVQLGLGAAVTMTYQRGGFVHQDESVMHHAEEHVEISAALRDRADIQRRVEVADAREHPAPVGHVRASAIDAGADVQRVRRVRTSGHAVPPALVSPTESAVALEHVLRRCLELVGFHESGDGHHGGVFAEDAHQRRDPSGIDHRIVIGERHDLASRLVDGPIARPVEARSRLPDVAHRGKAIGDQPRRRLGARRVVDHEDVKSRIVEGEQRLQTDRRGGRAVARADGGGDEWEWAVVGGRRGPS